MASSNSTPTPPHHADIPSDRAVDSLSSSTGASREHVRELLLAEITRLESTATITKYVHVLAASNIRERLRRAPRIQRALAS
jgi:hypothetical protein